jgi:hypothetical protein
MTPNTIRYFAHVLGSDGGYRTRSVALEVPVPVIRQLEQLDWFRDDTGDFDPDELLENPTAWMCACPWPGEPWCAIRRILPDPEPDFRGRRSMLVVSILMRSDDYSLLAGIADGQSGQGLESLVWDHQLWSRLTLEGSVTDGLLHVAPVDGEQSWTYSRREIMAVTAWRGAVGRDKHVVIPTGGVPDAFPIRLASKIGPSSRPLMHWGVRVFTPPGPGSVASYLRPHFQPGTAIHPDQLAGPPANKASRTIRTIRELLWHPWLTPAECEKHRSVELQQQAAKHEAERVLERRKHEEAEKRLKEAERQSEESAANFRRNASFGMERNNHHHHLLQRAIGLSSAVAGMSLAMVLVATRVADPKLLWLILGGALLVHVPLALVCIRKPRRFCLEDGLQTPAVLVFLGTGGGYLITAILFLLLSTPPAAPTGPAEPPPSASPTAKPPVDTANPKPPAADPPKEGSTGGQPAAQRGS